MKVHDPAGHSLCRDRWFVLSPEERSKYADLAAAKRTEKKKEPKRRAASTAPLSSSAPATSSADRLVPTGQPTSLSPVFRTGAALTNPASGLGHVGDAAMAVSTLAPTSLQLHASAGDDYCMA